MKQLIIFTVLILFAKLSFGQTNSELENAIKRNSLLLGATHSIINEVIDPSVFEEMKDEIINGMYVKTYYYKPLGSLIFFIFDKRSWSEYEKVCVRVVETFGYPSSQYNSFITYLNSRSVFKKVTSSNYIYLASTSLIYNALSEQGYKIVLSVDEKIINAQNKYGLTCTLDLTNK